ncbi:MAG: tRNA uridine-5-carboxymethylaminomethyl(34) synthesis GTPase MnmE [Alkalispirochaeta sp.]
MEHDLIAALATPFGSAALGVIRTSGPGAVAAIAALTDRHEAIVDAPGGTMKRALIVDPAGGETLDDVMLGVFREPRSYTGEEAVEIYCHGSIPGIQAILALLYRSGYRPADPGEFTQRAFLAGKIDLTRAEAVQEIVSSQTVVGHEMALRRLGGSIEGAINDVKAVLVRIMAQVAVQLDYPDDEIDEVTIDPEPIRMARERLSALAGSYRTGRLYQEGVTIAIAGRTNAGKSSLFNALLREDRAIVSEIHGTTRDYISSRIDLEGIPVEIYDTAGLRETSETIEEEGIRRTRALVTGTDLVLYVVDAVVGVTVEDVRILEEIVAAVEDRRRILLVLNKLDSIEKTVDTLDVHTDGTDSSATTPDSVAVSPAPETSYPDFVNNLVDTAPGTSAITMEGIDRLINRIVTTIVPGEQTKTGAPVIDSLRQKNLLDRAVEALDEVITGITAGVPVDAISVDLQEALHALGEITGEVTSEDILDAVFSGFCVGK